MCLATLIACNTLPTTTPIDYGTKGVGAVGPSQSRALFNCYLAGDTATKIVELRTAGSSDTEILKFYEKVTDKNWMSLIHDVLPIVAEDNPPASEKVEYGRNFYERCMRGQFDEKAIQVALYCYRLTQFASLAFSFRNIGDPMEAAYTKMPAYERVRAVTDGILTRGKRIPRSDEAQFRVQTYYGCLGHPDINPLSAR
jgi:hypothetical protein